MERYVKLNNGRIIGNDEHPYIIAELCANHNGDIEIAKRMIQAAKIGGCHCVKFQSWSKDSLFSKTMYDGNPGLEREVEQYSITSAQLQELKTYCDQLAIDFASTPLSYEETDFLVEKCNVPFLKIASMDVNNYPFLAYVAAKQVPIMLALGLSDISEVDRAIRTIEQAGNRQIILLHCVANYPPEPKEVNLRHISTLQMLYPHYPIGFSDHSIGTHIPLAAVTLGACVVEKHFTLDKTMPGWDHAVSANPEDMKSICSGAREIFDALGSTQKIVGERELEKRKVFRRSVVAAKDIPAGKIIDEYDLTCKRPGTGLPPESIQAIIGKVSQHEIAKDVLLKDGDF